MCAFEREVGYSNQHSIVHTHTHTYNMRSGSNDLQRTPSMHTHVYNRRSGSNDLQQTPSSAHTHTCTIGEAGLMTYSKLPVCTHTCTIGEAGLMTYSELPVCTHTCTIGEAGLMTYSELNSVHKCVSVETCNRCSSTFLLFLEFLGVICSSPCCSLSF